MSLGPKDKSRTNFGGIFGRWARFVAWLGRMVWEQEVVCETY